MTLKVSKIRYDSAIAGLGNTTSTSFFFDIPSHTVPVGGATAWLSSWPLDNPSAISSVQINLSGLETLWRPVSGSIALKIPYSGTQYEIEIITYYSGGRFRIAAYMVNEIGSTVTIPHIIVNVRIFQFNAPF
jgi:hypothetical protein